MEVLRTEHLCRSFGAVKAVNDINLYVHDGQIKAVIGSNGAGKTTLLDLITNRTSPSSGRVYYCEKDITNLPTHRIVKMGIGKCFQISKLFNRLTAYENIQIACICHQNQYLNFYLDAKEFLDAKVQEILKLVKLDDKADVVSGTLSYGDQRKLEIGVTLALEPKLLMLDEPTAGISRTEGYELMQLITKIVKKRKITIVFIEHDMDIVFNFAESITVMHRGEHLATGTPEEIKNNPLVKETYLGEL